MGTSGKSVDPARSLRTDLRALADFLPAFRQPAFKAGKWAGGEEMASGTIQMPYVSYYPVTEAFYEAAYEHGWVKRDFDWPTWMRSDEARLLRNDETALHSAKPEQLARLLTVCIRQDRFVEGALLEAFDSGLILRIIERAAVLLSDLSSSDGG